MTNRPILALALALVLASAGASSAVAQSRTAEAEQLFRDGKRLMAKGQFAEACAAFEASQQREPALSTRLNLADCREKNGQLATAWGLFVEIEHETHADKKQAGVHRTAGSRADAIESRLSYLTISVPDESRVEGLVVTRNGEVVDQTLWNRALPIDGGQVIVAGRAPGHEEWSTTLTVQAEGGKVSVEVPRFKALKDIAVEPPPTGEPEPEPEAEPVAQPVIVAPPSAPRMWTARRKVSLVVGVAGVAALGAGAWLGLDGRDLRDDALALCPDNPCANAYEANALGDRAESRGLFANVAFGTGGAAIATAVVLWWAGGESAASSVTVSASPAFNGVLVQGAF